MVAATDCTVRGLARERFLGFVRVDPDLCRGGSPRCTAARWSTASSAPASGRACRPRLASSTCCAACLDANDTGGLHKEVHLRLPFTHRELARLLSLSPRQLTALLARLQRDDVIRLRRDRLIITDLSGVRDADPASRDVGWPVNA